MACSNPSHGSNPASLKGIPLGAGQLPVSRCLEAHCSAQLRVLHRSPGLRIASMLRVSAKCHGTTLYGNSYAWRYTRATSPSCLGITNSPAGFCSKERKIWRPEPKTLTAEQAKAGEFQVFSYVSPQQRRGNKSKGTTALSFSTWAASILSIIHLLK